MKDQLETAFCRYVFKQIPHLPDYHYSRWYNILLALSDTSTTSMTIEITVPRCSMWLFSFHKMETVSKYVISHINDREVLGFKNGEPVVCNHYSVTYMLNMTTEEIKLWQRRFRNFFAQRGLWSEFLRECERQKWYYGELKSIQQRLEPKWWIYRCFRFDEAMREKSPNWWDLGYEWESYVERVEQSEHEKKNKNT